MKPDRHRLSERVGRQAAQKQRARRSHNGSIWLGLGMFGLVGWSVATPMLLGLALGRWIDTTWPGQVSWTLTLLLAGVVLGCLNAWHWVGQERRVIERRRDQTGGERGDDHT
jgi:ATP synthase protein I